MKIRLPSQSPVRRELTFSSSTRRHFPQRPPSASIAVISDYKASDGDLIDFSSLLQISYAPLSADAAQLRVAEDVSATFATLQLNVGNAANPFWTAVVKLDGVHAGDAVNALLDATHTVHLSAGWLV